MKNRQAVFDGNTGKFYRNIVKNSEYSDFIQKINPHWK